jgi:hypothetical protein
MTEMIERPTEQEAEIQYPKKRLCLKDLEKMIQDKIEWQTVAEANSTLNE